MQADGGRGTSEVCNAMTPIHSNTFYNTFTCILMLAICKRRLCMCMCVCGRVCACVPTHTRICVCMWLCVWVCVHVGLCVCMCMFVGVPSVCPLVTPKRRKVGLHHIQVVTGQIAHSGVSSWLPGSCSLKYPRDNFFAIHPTKSFLKYSVNKTLYLQIKLNHQPQSLANTTAYNKPAKMPWISSLRSKVANSEVKLKCLENFPVLLMVCKNNFRRS